MAMFKRSWGRYLFGGTLLFCFSMCALEGVAQYSERKFLQAVAREIVGRLGRSDTREQVIALRDYLRANVTYEGAAYDDRPFFRDSAAETLRSGKGYCGEVTRTFICLADAVGIRAQRINLWGKEPHVVAEVELGPDDRVIVDCQSPPKIDSLERLDDVMSSLQYTDYYTLNLRRLHV